MNRNISLDVLKLLLAVMVVGQHTNFLVDINSTASYLMVNGLFRIAVPLFLLINGFYFYDILHKNKEVNWIKRLLRLYLIWMLVYSYFWIRGISTNSFMEIVAHVFLTLAIGYWHLWYVVGILSAAILLMFIRKMNSLVLISLASAFFSTGVFIQYAGNYHLIDSVFLDRLFNWNPIHRNFLFFSFPFFLMGFLIKKHEWYKKISREIIYLFLAIGFCFLFTESLLNYIFLSGREGFDNYLSLIFVCPFIFLLFVNVDIQGSSKNISLYANGIYFSHAFFILILNSEYFYIKKNLLTYYVIFLSIIFCYCVIKNKKLVKNIF